MPWYFFAAAPMFLYGVSNFVDKFLIEKKIKDPLAMVTLSGLVTGFLGLVIGFISGFRYLGESQTVLILLAGLFLIFYLIPYYKALKLDDVSRVAPLFQFIPVFTLILSTIFLKETLSTRQTVGLILVVIAGIILSTERIESKLFRPGKAMWLMILASFMYSCVLILFRFVVREAGYWTTLSWQYIGIGVGAIALLFLGRIRKSIKEGVGQLKSSLPLVSANNGIALVADMSGSYAISLVSVPLVTIIGGIQPLIVLIYGLVLSLWFPKIIREDIRKSTIIQKVASIILIFIGLYLAYA